MDMCIAVFDVECYDDVDFTPFHEKGFFRASSLREVIDHLYEVYGDNISKMTVEWLDSGEAKDDFIFGEKEFEKFDMIYSAISHDDRFQEEI